MTRDEIIRMAREVGMQGMLTDVVTTIDELERLVALVEERAAAAEREECANVAAWILKMPQNDVSAAMRAGGN
jgi:hypothetical protein